MCSDLDQNHRVELGLSFSRTNRNMISLQIRDKTKEVTFLWQCSVTKLQVRLLVTAFKALLADKIQ